MTRFHRLLLLSLLPLAACQHTPAPKVVLAIHGGAGTIVRDRMDAELEAAYRTKLEQALRAGYASLKQGEEAVEAVQAAILIMEDSPLFNAGHGAVLTAEGTCAISGTGWSEFFMRGTIARDVAGTVVGRMLIGAASSPWRDA